MLNPLGYYVLVKVAKTDEVEMGSQGRYRVDGDDLVDTITGIRIPKKGAEVDKKNAIEETGEIVAFGPTAYLGWQGCTLDDVQRTGKPAPELWGVKAGDKVEFKRYEGKTSYVEGFENYRYIPDTHIMGVVNG